MRPFSQTRGAAQQALTSLKVGLERAEFAGATARGPEASIEIRGQVLHRAQTDLVRILRTHEPSDAGHEGRPQDFHEPINRTAGERKANIVEININVDRLEEYAHTDEKFGTLHRIACWRDSNKKPLISEMQLRAGRELQSVWIMAQVTPCVRSPDAGGGSSPKGVLADSVLTAMQIHRAAMKHVGASNETTLEAIVIKDMSLSDFGRTFTPRLRREALVPLLRAALDALIAFWRTRDGARWVEREEEGPLHPYHGERAK